MALTLIALQILGTRLDLAIESNAQPTVLRPLATAEAAANSKPHGLAHPWFPGASGAAHDRWTIEALNGNLLGMRDLRGKAVFLNFWNTSCVPCVEEMSSIEQLEKSLQGERAAFLLVTSDKRETVTEFISKTRFDLPVFLSAQNVPADLQIHGYPTTYILNASGSIVYEYVGAADWNTDDARRFILSAAVASSQ